MLFKTSVLTGQVLKYFIEHIAYIYTMGRLGP